MWRWTSGEIRANVLRETASPRTLSPLIRTPIWTVFHARAAFQELSQLPQLHPDRVLMRRRDEGVEADAREWALVAQGGAELPPCADRSIRALAGMLAVFAEFERDILRDRVKAGIDQARKDGKPHGRPMTAGKLVPEMKQLRKERLSKREIAKRLGVSRTSVIRLLRPNKHSSV